MTLDLLLDNYNFSIHIKNSSSFLRYNYNNSFIKHKFRLLDIPIDIPEDLNEIKYRISMIILKIKNQYNITFTPLKKNINDFEKIYLHYYTEDEEEETGYNPRLFQDLDYVKLNNTEEKKEITNFINSNIDINYDYILYQYDIILFESLELNYDKIVKFLLLLKPSGKLLIKYFKLESILKKIKKFVLDYKIEYEIYEDFFILKNKFLTNMKLSTDKPKSLENLILYKATLLKYPGTNIKKIVLKNKINDDKLLEGQKYLFLKNTDLLYSEKLISYTNVQESEVLNNFNYINGPVSLFYYNIEELNKKVILIGDTHTPYKFTESDNNIPVDMFIENLIDLCSYNQNCVDIFLEAPMPKDNILQTLINESQVDMADFNFLDEGKKKAELAARKEDTLKGLDGGNNFSKLSYMGKRRNTLDDLKKSLYYKNKDYFFPLYEKSDYSKFNNRIKNNLRKNYLDFRHNTFISTLLNYFILCQILPEVKIFTENQQGLEYIFNSLLNNVDDNLKDYVAQLIKYDEIYENILKIQEKIEDWEKNLSTVLDANDNLYFYEEEDKNMIYIYLLLNKFTINHTENEYLQKILNNEEPWIDKTKTNLYYFFKSRELDNNLIKIYNLRNWNELYKDLRRISYFLNKFDISDPVKEEIENLFKDITNNFTSNYEELFYMIIDIYGIYKLFSSNNPFHKNNDEICNDKSSHIIIYMGNAHIEKYIYLLKKLYPSNFKLGFYNNSKSINDMDGKKIDIKEKENLFNFVQEGNNIFYNTDNNFTKTFKTIVEDFVS